MQKQFGAAFKLVRLAKGLTQESFAEESGRTYISELERGVKQPTLQKIDTLASRLAVHPLTPMFLAYLDRHDDESIERLTKVVESEVRDILRSEASK